MIETMPNPLTPSDKASLAKLQNVIDMAHHDFNMKVWIVLCPNVAADDEHASRVTFEQRHFFYCDTRVNPADPKAMNDQLHAMGFESMISVWPRFKRRPTP